MQVLKVVIADDEPIARDIIETYIAKVPSLQLVASCKNAVEVFEHLNKQDVDLLLLDINMPEITGMDLVKTLRNPPMVIFTTAYNEYAVESYDLNAVDYLLKPIPFDRFVKAINKALDKNEVPAEQTSVQTADEHFFVKSGTKLVKIKPDEVLYIEAMKDYAKIHLQAGNVVVHSTMKNIEEQLSVYTSFVRVSKSYIVNLHMVEAIEANMLYISGVAVTIGNSFKDDVLQKLDLNRLA